MKTVLGKGCHCAKGKERRNPMRGRAMSLNTNEVERIARGRLPSIAPESDRQPTTQGICASSWSVAVSSRPALRIASCFATSVADWDIIHSYKPMKTKGGWANVAARKLTPADALKVVIETLTPLEPAEKQWILQSAASLWSVAAPGIGVTPQSPLNPASLQRSALPANGGQDPKSFMKLKNPQSETQRVACLAYYLANFRETHAFKAGDVKKLNDEAKGPSFNVPRAVGNAANAKHRYLSSIGGGQKQITSHGEEIVDALPDIDKVKEVETRKKTKRGRPRKKKSRSA